MELLDLSFFNRHILKEQDVIIDFKSTPKSDGETYVVDISERKYVPFFLLPAICYTTPTILTKRQQSLSSFSNHLLRQDEHYKDIKSTLQKYPITASNLPAYLIYFRGDNRNPVKSFDDCYFECRPSIPEIPEKIYINKDCFLPITGTRYKPTQFNAHKYSGYAARANCNQIKFSYILTIRADKISDFYNAIIDAYCEYNEEHDVCFLKCDIKPEWFYLYYYKDAERHLSGSLLTEFYNLKELIPEGFKSEESYELTLGDFFMSQQKPKFKDVFSCKFLQDYEQESRKFLVSLSKSF